MLAGVLLTALMMERGSGEGEKSVRARGNERGEQRTNVEHKKGLARNQRRPNQKGYWELNDTALRYSKR